MSKRPQIVLDPDTNSVIIGSWQQKKPLAIPYELLPALLGSDTLKFRSLWADNNKALTLIFTYKGKEVARIEHHFEDDTA